MLLTSIRRRREASCGARQPCGVGASSRGTLVAVVLAAGLIVLAHASTCVFVHSRIATTSVPVVSDHFPKVVVLVDVAVLLAAAAGALTLRGKRRVGDDRSSSFAIATSPGRFGSDPPGATFGARCSPVWLCVSRC